MAANEQTDPPQAATSKSTKKHKKKKSKAATVSIPGDDTPKQQEAGDEVNGENNDENHDDRTAEEGANSKDIERPTETVTPSEDDDGAQRRNSKSIPRRTSVRSNGVDKSKWAPPSISSQRPAVPDASSDDGSDPTSRLDAAVKERNQLRDEFTEFRKSLESIQQRHQSETGELRQSLEESKAGRDHAETRYQKLLGQVNTIKAQLGERLKADAADLSQARQQIDDLEGNKRSLMEANEALQAQVSQLNTEKEEQAQEAANLRGRTSVSQANWAKERADLMTREAHALREFEEAKQAMQDWEILATDERSMREGLSDKVTELEEQLSSHRELWERVSSERESQSSTVDGLQRALQEVHEARKQERRELVESSQVQSEELKRLLKAAEASSSEATSALETARQELERARPFEKEVKDKNLLIGKLRHEAVILNDHLTKALRFLKKGKPEDNVDRQLVTNHFLQFLSLDRSDPKKFQVLQLISALLGWTEEQKESAGLARPGASTQTNLKLPLSSPFRRASSTAALSPLNSAFPAAMGSSSVPATPDIGISSPASKEGLAELWSDFLEREAQEGGPDSRRHSRRSSSGLGTPTGKGNPLSPSASSGSPGLKIPKQRLEELDEGGGSGASTPKG